MRTDFILDFETIGQGARVAPGIECSYTTFVWDRFLDEPYSFQELLSIIQKSKLDLKDQIKNYDFSYKEEDLNWWMEKPPEVRRLLKPKPDDLKLTQFVETLLGYLRRSEKIEYWWSRSNTFDPIILDHMSQAVGKYAFVNEYLPYWRVRDTRTFIDAKFNFTTKNGFVPVANVDQWEKVFNAHDSRHDIAADILRLQAIHRAESDMEQIEI